MAVSYPGPSVQNYLVSLGVGVTQGTTTFAHLKVASPLFVVCTTTDNTYSVSSITFDGLSLTQSHSFVGATTGRLYQFWTLSSAALAAKLDGTYNVVITNSASNKQIDAFLVEYGGVINDFSSKSDGQQTFSSSPVAFTHTTVAADSWLFVFGRFSAGFRLANGSSDGQYRMSGTFTRFIVDSGASEGAAGSKSVNVTSASAASGVVEYLAIELKRETSLSLSITDTPTFTNPEPIKNPTHVEDDVASFTDSQRKALTKNTSDSQVFLDGLVYLVSRIFTSVASFADTVRSLFSKRVSEVVSFADSLRPKTLVRRVTEVIDFNDLSPLFDGVWIDRSEPSSSWADRSEPSSSWADRSRPGGSWSDRSEPSASWSDRTPPSTPWS